MAVRPMHPSGSLFFRWTAVHPYALLDEEDSVDMVGHNDKFIYRHLFPDGCGFEPFLLYNFSIDIQMHFPINNLSKKTSSLKSANRDKIGAGKRIIIPL